MLHEFAENFLHNLFKPLLLFFYLGFLVPILKVEFEFPYVIYQGLTLYLLLAIGWHGGEELADIDPSHIDNVIGFMLLGFVTNTAIGFVAYRLLRWMTSMRRVDTATVAGYYGSDSAGTFATCVGVLTAVGLQFDGYMPVMLAIMEMPGCLVALFLVARLRRHGMSPTGLMPDEPGYDPRAVREPITSSHDPETPLEEAIEKEVELALEKREHSDWRDAAATGPTPTNFAALLREVLLNPGLYLLFGGITVGFISGLQGESVVHDDNTFFITAFQGALSLFLLEMGITASRKLRDLKSAGAGFVAFGLLMPNVFATLGITIAHTYSQLTHTHFHPGSYVLFAVLCAAASYIAVPAVQRLAIPEASPSLPLAASLGLTFSYNVTIGIPVYIEIARLITGEFPPT